jgi:tetratricopeptide (TPR) repeat protein
MKATSKLIIFIVAFLSLAASAYAQNPREELKQMVEQLQTSPNDNALREKIIKLAAEIKPAPAVPPDARRTFVMGATYLREGKSSNDFELAVKAFQEATVAAPWWGDAYYNLSIALESAKRYDEAKTALTLYLLTQPKDAEQVQDRLYALDAKKVLAVKQQEDDAKAQRAEVERRENSPEGRVRRDEELIRSLDGAIFVDKEGFGFEQQFVVSGRQLRLMNRRLAGNVCDCGGCTGPIGEIKFCQAIPLNGRVATIAPDVQKKWAGRRFTIAQDGRTITEIWINYWDGSDSGGNGWIYNRR